MSREARTSPGWVVVETVKGDDLPNVVFEDGRMRPFSHIGRRTNFKSQAVTDAIVKATRKVQSTGERRSDRVALTDGTPVHYHVLPIFGPHDEVYGTQIWLGRKEDVVVKPRNVEGYSFDLQTGLTSHGPGVDENILSIDAVDTTRPSHDRIFSFYDNFPKLNDLGLYIKDIENGLTAPTPFQAEISLTDGRGVQRNIHVSQVNKQTAADTPELRGLLHEVTDVSPHTINYGLAMTKSIAAKNDPGVGRALIDLTTGIILDWINPPRGNLEPWSREIPDLSNRGQQQAAALRQLIMSDRTLKYTEKLTEVRFTSSGAERWFDVVVGYEHHGENQGIMTVREAMGPLNPI